MIRIYYVLAHYGAHHFGAVLKEQIDDDFIIGTHTSMLFFIPLRLESCLKFVHCLLFE